MARTRKSSKAERKPNINSTKKISKARSITQKPKVNFYSSFHQAISKKLPSCLFPNPGKQSQKSLLSLKRPSKSLSSSMRVKQKRFATSFQHTLFDKKPQKQPADLFGPLFFSPILDYLKSVLSEEIASRPALRLSIHSRIGKQFKLHDGIFEIDGEWEFNSSKLHFLPSKPAKSLFFPRDLSIHEFRLFRGNEGLETGLLPSGRQPSA